MPQDRHLRRLRFSGETLQTADALARERTDRFRDLRECRGNRVVLPRIDANHARGLRRAIAADERPAERDRDLPENLAHAAPADRALHAIETLGDFDLAREHRKQSSLFAFVNRVLSHGELDIRGPACQVLELFRRQRGDERNGGEFFGR
jgi:hypothetical protein